MISKWASVLPDDCDSACIITAIYRLSFSASVKRITSLNDLGRTANLALPVTVTALYGVVVLVIDVALPNFFTELYWR